MVITPFLPTPANPRQISNDAFPVATDVDPRVRGDDRFMDSHFSRHVIRAKSLP
jgi:hypothetical protein